MLMAGEVMDMRPEAELLLPLEFPENEFFQQQQQQENKKSWSANTDPFPFRFPSEFPYECLSDSSSTPSSPVESATESESQSDDELDEYLGGLSSQMAQSFLVDADGDAGAEQKSHIAWSPACTVFSSGSKPSLVSRRCWQVSNDDTAFDAVYGAAGQQQYRGVLVYGGLSFPVGVAQALEEGGSGGDGCAGVGSYYSRYRKPAALTVQQLQAARLQQLKQHRQLVKQQLAAAAGWGRRRNGGSWSGWEAVCGEKSPPRPAAPSSGRGMRAVFLPGGHGQKASTGTGVFLPRRAGSPAHMYRKATACSTVLVPERVVHALNNLNLDGSAAAAAQPGGGFAVGGVPPRRGCFDVDADGGGGGNDAGAAVASSCYSSMMDGGGGSWVNYDHINKKKYGRGCEMLHLGAGAQEEQQHPRMKVQHQQQKKNPAILSPETALPPEWTY